MPHLETCIHTLENSPKLKQQSKTEEKKTTTTTTNKTKHIFFCLLLSVPPQRTLLNDKLEVILVKLSD